MKQNENNCLNKMGEVSSDFLRAYAYEHGDKIYNFMNKFRININTLFIEFSVDSFNLKKYIELYNINNEIEKLLIKKDIESYSLNNRINEYKFSTH